ncbi:MAG TPA: hypothetical protein VN605_08245, partial [Thermoanaerobaculia bacterium]|nr:hypothetical protein [Thermoanaerobaculia bacterium]
LALACGTLPLAAQVPATVNGTPHDISQVDPAPIGGSISVPLPPQQERRYKKYDMPELTGSRQAIGSQLIDGRLPRPLVDFSVHDANVEQRLSLFEGGLAVVNMTGAGGTIRKKVVIPAEAVQIYLKGIQPAALAHLDLKKPSEGRSASLRVYGQDGEPFVLAYDPLSTLPKALHEGLLPLEDLLRAISEDRSVTSTVAGYQPKVGDELVGDDRKMYRVQRVLDDGRVVELHCTSQPTILYVAAKDLYNYFVGARGGQQ